MGQVAEPSKLPARPQQPLGLAQITSTDSNNWEVCRCKGTSAVSLTQALIQVSDQQHCLSPGCQSCLGDEPFVGSGMGHQSLPSFSPAGGTFQFLGYTSQ